MDIERIGTRAMYSTKRIAMCAFLLSTLIAQVYGVCPDGVYESATEQCDDGNAISGDGCSQTCQLESASQWLCTSVEGGTTSCCRALTNPITLQKVCSCEGVTQPPTSLGYYIASNCEKRDINECAVNRGGCHENANCINYDATQNCMLTYEVFQPPRPFTSMYTAVF